MFAKLRGGYLLGDWIERAKQFASEKPFKSPKMILYSAVSKKLIFFLFVLNFNFKLIKKNTKKKFNKLLFKFLC